MDADSGQRAARHGPYTDAHARSCHTNTSRADAQRTDAHCRIHPHPDGTHARYRYTDARPGDGEPGRAGGATI